MIKPLRNQIIVKRDEIETTSAGGIILTEATQESPTEGTVIACGPGVRERGERVAPDVEVGDLVLFPQYAGKELNLDGETYLIMHDTDVYAILKES